MSHTLFHDRTGDAEHARPTVPYWRGMSLDEIERHAHTCGDTATLALIDLISDACGTRRSEAIERAVAMRQSVQEATATRTELTETQAEMRRMSDDGYRLRQLRYAVEGLLTPYTRRNPKPAPKWAQYLIDTLKREKL